MKRGLSLVCGVGVLICVIVAVVVVVRRPTARVSPGDGSKDGGLETRLNNIEKKPVSGTEPTMTGDRFQWSSVESTNYPVYIANLRAIGCPEQTLADIIIADVNQLYKRKAAPAKAKLAKVSTIAFWKHAQKQSINREEREALIADLAQLDEERKSVLTRLLGPGWSDENGFSLLNGVALTPQDQLLSFLPAEKRFAVQGMERRLRSRMKERIKPGELNSQDLRLIRDLQAEFENELASVLTPEELEDYQLRMSGLAGVLKVKLDAFNPTEEEFRQIYKIHKEAGEAISSTPNQGDPVNEFERTQSGGQTKRKIREAIGEERYKSYEKSVDADYVVLKRYGEGGGLDQNQLDRLYDLQKSAQSKAFATSIRGDLDAVAREDEFFRLRQLVVAEVNAILGPSKAAVYLDPRVGSGGWVARIGSALGSGRRESTRTLLSDQ